jgi:hypothetical protein
MVAATHPVAIGPLGEWLRDEGVKIMRDAVVDLCLLLGFCLQTTEGHEQCSAIVRGKSIYRIVNRLLGPPRV